MWLFGVITEYRMVTLAREKLEQMFPALQRLTGVLFECLVYLTQDVSWLPPSVYCSI